EECTGIGAAIIAGVGSGVFPDYRVAREFLKVRETLEPRPQYREMYAHKQKLFEDAHDALLELNHRISRSLQQG
ncbi:MAG TPA: xylulokinase, partial [Clostridia bacterium]|nr:xylulokinase [Clostridia bacterium]